MNDLDGLQWDNKWTFYDFSKIFLNGFFKNLNVFLNAVVFAFFYRLSSLTNDNRSHIFFVK